ncbi:hypothetical protein L1987_40414 [Smallanthus sonchifolius]|uniref:Uncharacterized protein n=1 Tax=Smallanthus sonchifolius TaxID=185202 RepID=A0ACB9GTR9_9ASTR|nr:hypothetical protein L1987_40414 [Smallanthus sonchifolius]
MMVISLKRLASRVIFAFKHRPKNITGFIIQGCIDKAPEDDLHLPMCLYLLICQLRMSKRRCESVIFHIKS